MSRRFFLVNFKEPVTVPADGDVNTVFQEHALALISGAGHTVDDPTFINFEIGILISFIDNLETDLELVCHRDAWYGNEFLYTYKSIVTATEGTSKHVTLIEITEE